MAETKPKKCIYVYIYKRFDTDLLSLYDAGYPVSAMMRAALVAYCHSIPFWFYMDDCTYFDLNDKKSVMIRFNVPADDNKMQIVLANIKHGYISNFCKTILRNSFVNQTTACYFSSSELTSLQVLHEQNIPIRSYKKFVHPISAYKGLSKITIDTDGSILSNKKNIQPVVPEHEQRVFVAPALQMVARPQTVNTSVPVTQTESQPVIVNTQPKETVPVIVQKETETINTTVNEANNKDDAAFAVDDTTRPDTVVQNDELFALFESI